MADTGRTFFIAGAGIAGLSLALALAKFGATVVVLERQEGMREHGAGLQVSPNARRILIRLGVERFLAPVAHEPRSLGIYPYGRRMPMSVLGFGATAQQRFGSPYAVAHRADLAQALFQACKRFANIDFLFGVQDFDVEPHARGVAVSVDEKNGRSRIARPFAFIGADGVHSITRTKMLGGPKARYTGYVAWRTLLPMDAVRDSLDCDNTSLFCGPGFHAVAYPLPHRKQVNIAVFSRRPARKLIADEPPRRIDAPTSMMQWKPLKAILTAAGETWTYWPLYSVKTREWFRGPVGILGDAAHAMLPFQAQGAAMAIEDAAILAPLLMTEPDGESAFARFQALRQQRVARVARVSASNGRIFHLRWPASFARDLVLATRGEFAHLDRLAWLYGYDPSPEIGTAPRGMLPGATK